MWQCSNCEYLNEELDDDCLKCGAARSDSEGAASGAEDTPAAEQPETSARQGKDSGDRSAAGAHAVTILLIIACVLALGAVGYLAWQRGLVGLIFQGLDRTETAAQAGPAEDIWAEAPPAPSGFKRMTRQAREAVDAVLGTAADTVVMFDDEGRLSPETQDALDTLARLGNDLAWQYGEFEQAVVRANDPQLGEYAQFVRERFAEAMIASMEVVAQAYPRDTEDGSSAYLLSDAYAQAIEEHGLLDPEGIRRVWDAAVHARHQLELDRQYTRQYRELAARVAALEEIHSQFNAQLAAMPPYTVRSGKLGKDARDLLSLLGELADKIQELVVEFEEYKSTLSGLEQSDQMKEYIAQFESLAKTDHLYAFEEIYKIYRKDRMLEHPVYSQVKSYYQFVLDHWSEAALRYQEIYQEAELTWARTWAD